MKLIDYEGNEIDVDEGDILAIAGSMNGNMAIISVKGFDEHLAVRSFTYRTNDFIQHNGDQRIRADAVVKIVDRGNYYRFYLDGACRPFDLFPATKEETIEDRFEIMKRDAEEIGVLLPEPVEDGE